MDIFDKSAPHNDKVIVAHYDLDGEPEYVLFSFGNLRPGSDARAARVREYDRYIEALRGQGCQTHVWDLEYWPRYRDSFCNGRLYKGVH